MSKFDSIFPLMFRLPEYLIDNYRNESDERKRFGLAQLKCYFPGIGENNIGSLEDMKEFLEEQKEDAHYVADVLLFVKDIKNLFTDEMYNYIRNTILDYSKVSNDPIYKEIIKQNGWDIEQIILKEPKNMLFGHDTPIKSIVGNNGDFSTIYKGIYKSLIPIAIYNSYE